MGSTEIVIVVTRLCPGQVSPVHFRDGSVVIVDTRHTSTTNTADSFVRRGDATDDGKSTIVTGMTQRALRDSGVVTCRGAVATRGDQGAGVSSGTIGNEVSKK